MKTVMNHSQGSGLLKMIRRTDPVTNPVTNTSHNGGVYKVFKQEGGKLKRVGTADENLNIFKK